MKELSASIGTHSALTGWCLSTGGFGDEAQCLGVFDALNIKPIIKRVHPDRWYRNLAPICPAQPHPDIAPPWPDLLIVSGRHALPYARFIRRHSLRKTFVSVLKKPGLPSSWFDFIWVPEHDQLTGSNVLSTLTAPNRLSQEGLNKGISRYQHLIADMPRPLVTVLIGGPSRSFQFGWNEAEQLVVDLIQLHQKTGCGFLISPSYRTGKDLIAFFNQRLSAIPAKIWDMEGDNPFLGYLGLGDFFIVTADSMNMLGEAAFTGRPVMAYHIPHEHHKFSRFYESMIAHGAMRWFNGELESWTYQPLDSTPVIAGEIGRRLLLHRAQRVSNNR